MVDCGVENKYIDILGSRQTFNARHKKKNSVNAAFHGDLFLFIYIYKKTMLAVRVGGIIIISLMLTFFYMAIFRPQMINYQHIDTQSI